jgi:hypothetical protein
MRRRQPCKPIGGGINSRGGRPGGATGTTAVGGVRRILGAAGGGIPRLGASGGGGEVRITGGSKSTGDGGGRSEA